MDKLKRLEKKLRALGYHCEFREEFNIPLVRLWFHSQLAYTVYLNGMCEVDEGILLGTERDTRKVSATIQKWLFEEGFINELEKLEAKLEEVGFNSCVIGDYISVCQGHLYIGRIELNGVFGYGVDYYELPNEKKTELISIIDEWKKGRAV